MIQNDGTRTRQAPRRAPKMVLLSSWTSSEIKLNAYEYQTNWLSRRLRLSRETAVALAELAFGGPAA